MVSRDCDRTLRVMSGACTRVGQGAGPSLDEGQGASEPDMVDESGSGDETFELGEFGGFGDDDAEDDMQSGEAAHGHHPDRSEQKRTARDIMEILDRRKDDEGLPWTDTAQHRALPPCLCPSSAQLLRLHNHPRRPISICSIGMSSLSDSGIDDLDLDLEQDPDFSLYATSSATSRVVTTPTSLEFSMEDLMEDLVEREGEVGEVEGENVGMAVVRERRLEDMVEVLEEGTGDLSMSTVREKARPFTRAGPAAPSPSPGSSSIPMFTSPSIPRLIPRDEDVINPSSSTSPSPSFSFRSQFSSVPDLFTVLPGGSLPAPASPPPSQRASPSQSPSRGISLASPTRSPGVKRTSPPSSIKTDRMSPSIRVSYHLPTSFHPPDLTESVSSSLITPLTTASLSSYSADTPKSIGPAFEALISRFPLPLPTPDRLAGNPIECDTFARGGVDTFGNPAQSEGLDFESIRSSLEAGADLGSSRPKAGPSDRGIPFGRRAVFSGKTPKPNDHAGDGQGISESRDQDQDNSVASLLSTSTGRQRVAGQAPVKRSRRRHSVFTSTPSSSCIHVRPPLFRSRSCPNLPSSSTLSPSSPQPAMLSPATIHSLPTHKLESDSLDYASLPLSTVTIHNTARPPPTYPISEPLPRVSEEAPGQVDGEDSPPQRRGNGKDSPMRDAEGDEISRRRRYDGDTYDGQAPSASATSQPLIYPTSIYRSPDLSAVSHGGTSGHNADRYSNSTGYTHSSSSGMSSTLAGGQGPPSVPGSVSSSPSTMVGSVRGQKSTFGPREGGDTGGVRIGLGLGLAPPAIIRGGSHYARPEYLASPPLPPNSPPLSVTSSPYSITKGLRLPHRSPSPASNTSSPPNPPPAPVRPPRLDMSIPSARFSGSAVAAAGNRAAEDMAGGNHFNHAAGLEKWYGDERDHRDLEDLHEEGGDRSGSPSSQTEAPFNLNNFAFPPVPSSEGTGTDIVSPASLRASPQISQAATQSSQEREITHIEQKAKATAGATSHGMTPSSSSSSGIGEPEDPRSDWARARQVTTGSTATTATTRSGSSYGAQPLPPLTSDFSPNGHTLAAYHRYATQGQGRGGRSPSASTGTLQGPPPVRSLQKLGHVADNRSFSTNTSAGSSHTPSQHPFSATSAAFSGRRQSAATVGSNRQSDPYSYAVPRGTLGKRPSADQLAAGGAMVDVMPSSYWTNDSNPLSVVIAPEREQNTNPHSIASTKSQDQDGEDTCPICVESLNASYRLPGEKAHIVPQCGHALHEACFTEVYGAVPRGPRASKINLGVCGVCRGDMRLEDEREDDGFGPAKSRGNSKFAAMTGMEEKTGPRRQRVTPASACFPTSTSTTSFHSALQSPLEVIGDDPLEAALVTKASQVKSQAMANCAAVIVPSITVKSEFSSISRIAGRGGKQVLTCLVTVEVPSAGPRPNYPAPVLPSSLETHTQGSPISPANARSSPSLASWDRNPPDANAAIPDFLMPASPAGDPFAQIAVDLRHRLVDYKSSAIESLGKIRLYDILRVRKGSFILDISVYLFKQALICVLEEKKKGIKSLLGSGGGSARGDNKEKGALKLKGRIYLRHVKRIIDSTAGGELSVTISMEDDSLDSFILTFTDRSSHDLWHRTLNATLQDAKGVQPPKVTSSPPTPSSGTTSNKLARMGMPEGAIKETLRSPNLIRPAWDDDASPVGHDMALRGSDGTSSLADKVQANFGAAPLAPQHTPVDLLIAFSIPSIRGSAAASAPLKLKLIKASLTFTCQSLGPRDRLSIVTFNPGMGTAVRKTAFLCPGRFSGREKLDRFIAGIVSDEAGSDDGIDADAEKDEFRAETGKDEKIDMVSGLNVGLDIVMQRKSKNPITGMILVNDSADSIKRSSMDLVLARAEAAGVPVHSMGYGKNQDPSGLWLISSHTHGTYTFVKEWYHLRDSLAGVIGGLTSIALTNMKVHLGAVDSDFKCRKVSGAPHAVLSTDGKDVDIELKELRFGQRLEVLVEMEVERLATSDDEQPEARSISNDQESHLRRQSENGSDATSSLAHHARNGDPRQMYNRSGGSAAGQEESRRGGENGDSLVQMSDDSLIDEVPVFDLDCSYSDPATGRTVARLSHPLSLTVAMLPARHTGPPSVADQAVSRRKFELMASESMTRALLLVSRHNWTQAQRILQETAKILMAVINQSLVALGDTTSYHPSANFTNASKSTVRKQSQARATAMSIQAVLGDLDFLQEGMEEQRDTFDRDHRHFGAQQALVLRTQKSWTARTPTEKLYCSEGPRVLLGISREWTAR